MRKGYHAQATLLSALRLQFVFQNKNRKIAIEYFYLQKSKPQVKENEKVFESKQLIIIKG